MSLLYLLILALVQGLTEFLPVSSSAHLILLPSLTGAEDQGLALDVAVHVGTLFAVILYFRRDVGLALRGTLDILRGNLKTEGAKLAILLVIATIPVVIAGLILKVTGLADAMRSITVIGWTMLGFGFVLYWTDQRGKTTKQMRDWTIRDAVVLGLWQALALIPGTSRSGATISGARMLGYGREQAARISMLMSIPTIIASGSLLALDVVGQADWAMAKDAVIAAVMAFVAAIFALTLMMRLLQSVSFTPYVVYRMGLGIVLLVIAYT
ncbi:MAG: undecaprenyl-diphosphate phosphatase [Rhodobacteraceae bacterium]|nr:undecaprenyl-diphosphate phosphatase [Paracoccaceae bacterium]